MWYGWSDFASIHDFLPSSPILVCCTKHCNECLSQSRYSKKSIRTFSIGNKKIPKKNCKWNYHHLYIKRIMHKMKSLPWTIIIEILRVKIAYEILNRLIAKGKFNKWRHLPQNRIVLSNQLFYARLFLWEFSSKKL